MYVAYEDANISIGMAFKRDPSDMTTHMIRSHFINKTG